MASLRKTKQYPYTKAIDLNGYVSRGHCLLEMETDLYCIG